MFVCWTRLRHSIPRYSVQLALLASGVATARGLQRPGVTCRAVGGLSVGAFAAAVVAEAITLKDAVILVRSRADKMEQLYPVGYGLAAIVGLNERQVAAVVDSVHTAAKSTRRSR
jgi:malonate decarboxylase epsilon subunit